MANFSVRRAIGAGFGLILRRPGTVLLWSLVYALVLGGPSVALMVFMGPDYVEFLRSLIESQGRTDPGTINAFNAKFAGLGNLNLLLNLAGSAVLYTAVFRSVLRPSESRFGYLRVGLEELIQGVLFVILYIGFAISMMLGMFVVMIPVGITAAMGSPGVSAVLGVVLVLALTGALLWAFSRLAMAMPMSMAERKFRLFEAWTFTKGKSISLVALIFSLILIALIFAAAIYGLFGGMIWAKAAAGGDVMGFFSRPFTEIWRDLGPLAVAYLIVMGLLSGPMMALFGAPWADAYRQMAGHSHDPAAAFE